VFCPKNIYSKHANNKSMVKGVHIDSEELNSYMKDIVKTTVGSVMKKDEPCIDKKKKSINCIRAEVYEIDVVEDILKEFNETYTPNLSKLSESFQYLDISEKKRINSLLGDLKFLINEIKLKSIINDNLISLSCYLARLKVTLLTKDKDLGKKIVTKFLKQKDMNLNYMIDEINDFEKKLSLLEQVYLKFIDTINGIGNGLENKISLNHSGVHSIDKLRNITFKQKEILYHIGINFVDITKNMLHDKDYRRLLKDTSFLK
jgi:hypothetical protein